MKRLLILILLLSPVWVIAGKSNTLFYEVSGLHLKKPSYLFGTIHTICKEDLVLGKRLLKKFKKADKLVLEIDMADPVTLIKLISVNQMPGDTSLDMLLTEDEFNYVTSYMDDSLGLTSSTYMKTKPILLFEMLVPKMLGCAELTAVDIQLMKMALRQNKDIEGLEKVEDQLDALAAISLHQQASMLYMQLKNFDQSSEQLKQMLDAYMQRDLQKLTQLVNQDGTLTGDANNKLLNERNKNWIPKIEEYMSQGSSFIAFGAAHLIGDEGVVKLLTDKGYTVKPIKE